MTDKQKRDRAVRAFAKNMIKKLDIKAKQGYNGWDKYRFHKMLKNKLMLSVIKYLDNDPAQLVDVGNFAMMLHYQAKQRGLL